MADQTWQTKPGVMSQEVLTQAAARIGEHAVEHEIAEPIVIFHGGEPLMNGPFYFDMATEVLRKAMPEGVQPQFRMQTNGVLLKPRMLAALAANDIHFGVSLDGAAETNDRNRPFKSGRGSFGVVAARLHEINGSEYRRLFRGILCTIDPTSDPRQTYETLKSFSPRRINFLLPHATHAAPPMRPEPAAYGKWLSTIFDLWINDGDSPELPLLESVVSGFAGGPSRTEGIGLTPVSMVVIESNGTYEQVDSLKAAYEGAPETGLDVFRHSLDDVLRLPAVRQRQIGLRALSQTCQQCRLVEICGGGNYVHRYSAENGFNNPSVYCTDLQELILHVNGRLTEWLASLKAAKSTESPAAP